MSRGSLNLFPGSLSKRWTRNGKVSRWLPIHLRMVPNERINDTRLCLLRKVSAIKSDLMISVDWNMAYPRERRLGIVVSIQFFLFACAGPSRPVLIYERPLSSHSILEGLSDQRWRREGECKHSCIHSHTQAFGSNYTRGDSRARCHLEHGARFTLDMFYSHRLVLAW